MDQTPATWEQPGITQQRDPAAPTIPTREALELHLQHAQFFEKWQNFYTQQAEVYTDTVAYHSALQQIHDLDVRFYPSFADHYAHMVEINAEKARWGKVMHATFEGLAEEAEALRAWELNRACEIEQALNAQWAIYTEPATPPPQVILPHQDRPSLQPQPVVPPQVILPHQDQPFLSWGPLPQPRPLLPPGLLPHPVFPPQPVPPPQVILPHQDRPFLPPDLLPQGAPPQQSLPIEQATPPPHVILPHQGRAFLPQGPPLQAASEPEVAPSAEVVHARQKARTPLKQDVHQALTNTGKPGTADNMPFMPHVFSGETEEGALGATIDGEAELFADEINPTFAATPPAVRIFALAPKSDGVEPNIHGGLTSPESTQGKPITPKEQRSPESAPHKPKTPGHHPKEPAEERQRAKSEKESKPDSIHSSPGNVIEQGKIGKTGETGENKAFGKGEANTPNRQPSPGKGKYHVKKVKMIFKKQAKEEAKKKAEEKAEVKRTRQEAQEKLGTLQETQDNLGALEEESQEKLEILQRDQDKPEAPEEAQEKLEGDLEEDHKTSAPQSVCESQISTPQLSPSSSAPQSRSQCSAPSASSRRTKSQRYRARKRERNQEQKEQERVREQREPERVPEKREQEMHERQESLQALIDKVRQESLRVQMERGGQGRQREGEDREEREKHELQKPLDGLIEKAKQEKHDWQELLPGLIEKEGQQSRDALIEETKQETHYWEELVHVLIEQKGRKCLHAQRER